MESNISTWKTMQQSMIYQEGAMQLHMQLVYTNEFRTLFIQWNAEDKYRSSNFILIKFYYSILYPDEGW